METIEQSVIASTNDLSAVMCYYVRVLPVSYMTCTTSYSCEPLAILVRHTAIYNQSCYYYSLRHILRTTSDLGHLVSCQQTERVWQRAACF